MFGIETRSKLVYSFFSIHNIYLLNNIYIISDITLQTVNLNKSLGINQGIKKDTAYCRASD